LRGRNPLVKLISHPRWLVEAVSVFSAITAISALCGDASDILAALNPRAVGRSSCNWMALDVVGVAVGWKTFASRRAE
jgi:hypothetical protein